MIDLNILNDLVTNILHTFDPDEQSDILQEECAELIKAISKCKRAKDKIEYKKGLDNMTEEISHVLISISVICRLFPIDKSDILFEINKKCKKYGFDPVVDNSSINNLYNKEKYQC